MKDVDLWKDIQGYGGKYQVSYSGQIRRVYKSGKTKILAQFKKSGKAREIYGDRLLVHLTDDNGKDHILLVHQIVAKHFLGKPKQGQVPYHVNGCIMDNWASNLEYIDKRKLGELTGASSRRQPVIKLDSLGETVDCYSSAREAGKQNFMSYQIIMDRCNGKCKKAFAPDGFEYAWEEKQKSINQAIRRIELSRPDDEDNKVINQIKQTQIKYAMDF
jgi:hypothetical protein